MPELPKLNFVETDLDAIAQQEGQVAVFIPETGKVIPYPNKEYFPFEENPIYSAYIDSRGHFHR